MSDREPDVETVQAIKDLVDYLEYDEHKDYQSRPKAERVNHIYTAVERVRGWLDWREYAKALLAEGGANNK